MGTSADVVAAKAVHPEIRAVRLFRPCGHADGEFAAVFRHHEHVRANDHRRVVAVANSQRFDEERIVNTRRGRSVARAVAGQWRADRRCQFHFGPASLETAWRGRDTVPFRTLIHQRERGPVVRHLLHGNRRAHRPRSIHDHD